MEMQSAASGRADDRRSEKSLESQLGFISWKEGWARLDSRARIPRVLGVAYALHLLSPGGC